MTPLEFAKLLKLSANQRVAIVVDGPSFYKSARLLGFDVDYQRLYSLISDHCVLHRAVYATGLNLEIDHDPVKPLFDWLCYNGWLGIYKPLDSWTDPTTNKVSFGCQLQSELTVAMLRVSKMVDHIMLFSSDQDLVAGIRAAQDDGARVTVLSYRPDDELRRAADQVVSLEGVMGLIIRGVRREHYREPTEMDVDDGAVRELREVPLRQDTHRAQQGSGFAGYDHTPDETSLDYLDRTLKNPRLRAIFGQRQEGCQERIGAVTHERNATHTAELEATEAIMLSDLVQRVVILFGPTDEATPFRTMQRMRWADLALFVSGPHSSSSSVSGTQSSGDAVENWYQVQIIKNRYQHLHPWHDVAQHPLWAAMLTTFPSFAMIGHKMPVENVYQVSETDYAKMRLFW